MRTDNAPGEGLWPLDAVDLPPAVRTAAGGAVRVGTLVRFEVTLHATPEAAAIARAAPGALAKRFLPEGGAVWPVISDQETLGAICGHAARAAQPGFFELCRAYEQHGKDRGAFLTEWLTSGGTGFAVANQGGLTRLITNYHVAREAVERLERTGGEHESRPQASRDLWVASAEGERSQAVWLEANASAAEWQAGRDWAVLLTRFARSPRPLPLRAEPARVGEQVWVLGFPARTRRHPTAYPEADGSLRVTTGTITRTEDSLTVSDADGVPGNSGSPVLDEQGRVLGVYRDSTHRDGEFDLRIGAYGGSALITPATCLPAWLFGP